MTLKFQNIVGRTLYINTEGQTYGNYFGLSRLLIFKLISSSSQSFIPIIAPFLASELHFFPPKQIITTGVISSTDRNATTLVLCGRLKCHWFSYSSAFNAMWSIFENSVFVSQETNLHLQWNWVISKVFLRTKKCNYFEDEGAIVW